MTLIRGTLPDWTSGDGSGYGFGDGDVSGYGYGFGDGSGYGYGSGDGDGDGSGYGYGYGFGDDDGSGYGYGFGCGYGDGDGYGYGDGYGFGYGDGYGFGDGDGFGSGYGDGYGCGDGFGSGSGDGDGCGDGFGSGYWQAAIDTFMAAWPDEHRARAVSARSAGATIAYWRSHADGTPSNGGRGEARKAGDVERLSGPLVMCGPGALHATLEPEKWQGKRVWIVALYGEVCTKDDKLWALHREILGEAWCGA